MRIRHTSSLSITGMRSCFLAVALNLLILPLGAGADRGCQYASFVAHGPSSHSGVTISDRDHVPPSSSPAQFAIRHDGGGARPTCWVLVPGVLSRFSSRCIGGARPVSGVLRAATASGAVSMPWAAVGAQTSFNVLGLLRSGLSSLQASSWWVWFMLLLCSTVGAAAEEHTKIGRALSSPLITMAAALVACNTGLLPHAAPVYNVVNSMLVPLAIPLLLLDADIRKVVTQTGTMMNAFLVGSVGTIVGTLVAAVAVPLAIGADGWKVAAALASRHIGGAVNYIAVGETLQMSAEYVAAGIAADNLVVALYFAALFGLASRLPGCGPESDSESQEGEATGGHLAPTSSNLEPTDSPALLYLKALTAAAAMCLTGEVVSQTLLKGSISSIPIISVLAVAAATVFSRLLAPLVEPGGHIATILMNIFFAVTGASGRIERVLASAPRLFIFSTVQLTAHLGFLLAVGRCLRLPYKELLLSSNACVGGPTTAAAMAGSRRWKRLILPSILVGIFGYATGTFIGLILGRLALLRLMPS